MSFSDFQYSRELYEHLNKQQQSDHLNAYDLAWEANDDFDDMRDAAMSLHETLVTDPDDPLAGDADHEARSFIKIADRFELYKRAAEVLMPPIVAYYPQNIARNLGFEPKLDNTEVSSKDQTVRLEGQYDKNDILGMLKTQANRKKESAAEAHDKKPVKPQDKVVKDALSAEEAALNKALDQLSPREKCVISLMFGLEDGNKQNGKSVAKIFKVNSYRITVIKDRALKRLQDIMNSADDNDR